MIYNFSKPRGVSSNHFLRFLVRRYFFSKAGFLGTLDPLAEGILPVFTGKYTKLIAFLGKTIKTYQFEIRFGFDSFSLDGEGYFTRSAKGSEISLEKLEEAKIFFLNQTEQMPPYFSAIKQKGQRAYQSMRRGKIPQTLPLRKVKIHQLDFLFWSEDSLQGRMVCDEGFYIRAWVRDFCAFLQKPGYLFRLVREGVGDFFLLDKAIGLEKIWNTPKAENLPATSLQKIFTKMKFLSVENFSEKICLNRNIVLPRNIEGKKEAQSSFPDFCGLEVSSDLFSSSPFGVGENSLPEVEKSMGFLLNKEQKEIAFGTIGIQLDSWIFSPRIIF